MKGMRFPMETLIDGHVNALFNSVTYRIGCALVDAGDVWEGFRGVGAVLLTHGHFDHIYGLDEVMRLSPEARVHTNEAGRGMLLDAKRNLSQYHGTPFVFTHPERIVVVRDGWEVELGGGLKARAVFTPGHNPSCITWVVGGALFTGDAYIPGLKTVTNLPGGDRRQAEESLKRIAELSEGRTICPGHKEQQYQ